MKKLNLLVAVCLVALMASAQKAATVKRLNGNIINTKLLQQRIARLVDSGHLTGLQVAIINDDKIVWVNSFGLKNVEKQTRIDDSTVMYGASLTKTVTSYLFLKLADKGIFSLDKPIYKYLKKPISEYPKWKDLGDDTASFNKITPRMLLSHTSGIPILRMLYHDKLNLIAKPGEKFYYSDEGMNLIGFVMEEYTGENLEVMAQREIFKPLHMFRISMIWNPAFEGDFSMAYFKDGKILGSERKKDPKGAGSMSTTATDYAKFVVELQKQCENPNSPYREMFRPQISIITTKGFGPERDSLTNENKKTGFSWGLGMGLIKTPYGKAYFHAGHGEANQNYYVAYPSKKIAVVLLSNSENFEHTAPLLLKAIIGDIYSPLKWLGYYDN